MLYRVDTMSAQEKRVIHSGPVVDEWGFYDPDRAGLNALFEKLDARTPATSLPAQDDVKSMASSMLRAATLTPDD